MLFKQEQYGGDYFLETFLLDVCACMFHICAKTNFVISIKDFCGLFTRVQNNLENGLEFVFQP